jgi:hypothetical protein
MDYFALFLVFFVGIVIFYGIIVIHDIPYEIAVHRNHPHQDALHIAGWVSLFTLHVLWPFLWIWATLYREDRGWGMGSHQKSNQEIEQLKSEITSLKNEVVDIKERLTNDKAH